LWWLNEDYGLWVPQGTDVVVDTANNTISATVDHFSAYVAIASPLATVGVDASVNLPDLSPCGINPFDPAVEPISVAILIDNSGSTTFNYSIAGDLDTASDPEKRRLQFADDLIQTANQDNQYAIVPFGDPARDYSNTDLLSGAEARSALLEAAPEPDSGSNPWLAIGAALDLLESRSGRRAIVVIADSAVGSAVSASQAARAAGIPIHTVSLDTAGPAEVALENMAVDSGGVFFAGRATSDTVEAVVAALPTIDGEIAPGEATPVDPDVVVSVDGDILNDCEERQGLLGVGELRRGPGGNLVLAPNVFRPTSTENQSLIVAPAPSYDGARPTAEQVYATGYDSDGDFIPDDLEAGPRVDLSSDATIQAVYGPWLDLGYNYFYNSRSNPRSAASVLEYGPPLSVTEAQADNYVERLNGAVGMLNGYRDELTPAEFDHLDTEFRVLLRLAAREDGELLINRGFFALPGETLCDQFCTINYPPSFVQLFNDQQLQTERAVARITDRDYLLSAAERRTLTELQGLAHNLDFWLESVREVIRAEFDLRLVEFIPDFDRRTRMIELAQGTEIGLHRAYRLMTLLNAPPALPGPQADALGEHALVLRTILFDENGDERQGLGIAEEVRRAALVEYQVASSSLFREWVAAGPGLLTAAQTAALRWLLSQGHYTTEVDFSGIGLGGASGPSAYNSYRWDENVEALRDQELYDTHYGALSQIWTAIARSGDEDGLRGLQFFELGILVEPLAEGESPARTEITGSDLEAFSQMAYAHDLLVVPSLPAPGVDGYSRQAIEAALTRLAQQNVSPIIIDELRVILEGGVFDPGWLEDLGGVVQVLAVVIGIASFFISGPLVQATATGVRLTTAGKLVFAAALIDLSDLGISQSLGNDRDAVFAAFGVVVGVVDGARLVSGYVKATNVSRQLKSLGWTFEQADAAAEAVAVLRMLDGADDAEIVRLPQSLKDVAAAPLSDQLAVYAATGGQRRADLRSAFSVDDFDGLQAQFMTDIIDEFIRSELDTVLDVDSLGQLRLAERLVDEVDGAADVISAYRAAGVRALDEDPVQAIEYGVACGVGGNSFAAGTVVHTPSGKVSIDEVRVGDELISVAPDTSVRTTEIVQAVWTSEKDTVNAALATGEMITATANHLFWNETDQAWSYLRSFDDTDRFWAVDDGNVTLRWIEHTGRTEPVFNLTVSGPHTYLVGETGVLAHNINTPFACETTLLFDELMDQAVRVGGALDDVDPGSVSKIGSFVDRLATTGKRGHVVELLKLAETDPMLVASLQRLELDWVVESASGSPAVFRQILSTRADSPYLALLTAKEVGTVAEGATLGTLAARAQEAAGPAGAVLADLVADASQRATVLARVELDPVIARAVLMEPPEVGGVYLASDAYSDDFAAYSLAARRLRIDYGFEFGKFYKAPGEFVTSARQRAELKVVADAGGFNPYWATQVDEFGPGNLSNAKGAWGEMVTEVWLRDAGFIPLINKHVTSVVGEPGRGWGGNGIDHVWYNPETRVFVVADTKTGTARLEARSNGFQLSTNWINRLLNATVDPELAPAIREAGYDRVVAAVSDAGDISFFLQRTPDEVPGSIPKKFDLDAGEEVTTSWFVERDRVWTGA